MRSECFRNSCFFPSVLRQNIVLTLMCIVGLWILAQSPPPFSLSWLGVCCDFSVHWERLVNAMTSDSWGTHMCVRQPEQSHVPRTPVKSAAAPTLWRTCSTCSVFFCFAPSKQLRLQPAFDVCWTFCSRLCQAEKRPQWPRSPSQKPPRRIERKEDGGKAKGGKTRTERKRD